MKAKYIPFLIGITLTGHVMAGGKAPTDEEIKEMDKQMGTNVEEAAEGLKRQGEKGAGHGNKNTSEILDDMEKQEQKQDREKAQDKNKGDK